MSKATRALTLLAPLAAGCLAVDDPDSLDASPRSAAGPTGDPAGGPTGGPDSAAVYEAWQDAFDDSFSDYEASFLRSRSDEDLPPLYAAWSAVNADDVLPAIGDFGPQPVPAGPENPSYTLPIDWEDLYPCDRPPVGQLTFTGCSFDEQQILEVSHDQIQFGVWRALQRIHWVLATPDDQLAAQRWSAKANGQETAPSDWFGAFDRSRAEAVAETLEKGWAQLNMQGEIQVSCWNAPTWWEWMFVPFKATVLMQSPCSYDAALAHTIWVGHPPLNPWVSDPAYEVCDRYFEHFDELAPNLNAGQRGYLGGALLHEMLHFDVVGDCGGFPESSCDQVGPVPGYRNFLDVGAGRLKDGWSDDACDLVIDDGKCYQPEEGLAMAADAPSHAIRLPLAYQYFAGRTADMYVYGHCIDAGNVCFGPDTTDPACEGTEPDCGLPGGDACQANPGIPGCGCLDVDGGYLTDESGYPDGAGSFLGGADDGRYCPEDDVVCGVVQTECGERAACQTCGEDTNVGCACDDNGDCAGLEPNLRCWGGTDEGWPHAPGGTGVCLPDGSTPSSRDELEGLPWFCLENCAATDQWDDKATCIYNQSGYEFDHGTCVHYDSCGGGYGYPGACEEDGMVCDGNSDCLPVCESDADCQMNGFPAYYVCREVGQTAACVPPECAGGGLLGYCGLFVPQM
jgi:hypothetical protein